MWDTFAQYQNPRGGFVSIFDVHLTEGATYDIFSSSQSDPKELTIYDVDGKAIFVNSEEDDGPGFSFEGDHYSDDVIRAFVAPYTGVYFIRPNWVNSLRDYVTVEVYADTDTARTNNQSLTGGVSSEIMHGGSGADAIIALDGADTVSAGAGDDDANGNKGADLVYGGPGADTVRGGQDNDTIYGDDGADPHVNGNLGDDLVFGGFGDDTLYGGQGADTLKGGDGGDLLSGDLGAGMCFMAKLALIASSFARASALIGWRISSRWKATVSSSLRARPTHSGAGTFSSSYIVFG